MRLTDLLRALPLAYEAPEADPEISAPITENAQQVESGGIFLARQGRVTDGHQFIPTAIQNGAAAIIGEQPQAEVAGLLGSTPYVRVDSGYEAFGYLVAAYYGHPSRRLVVVGVTGTDGKTTSAMVIYHILKAAGVRVGLITTVSAIIGDRELATGLHVTNPPAHQLQRYLSEMVEAGMSHCVLEVTSFGLDQGRVNGTHIDVAVLTNVTHEHLDWHGGWEAYRDAKARLFQIMRDTPRKGDQPNIAVINADDPAAPVFAEASIGADYMLLYSLLEPEADFFADRVHYTPSHTTFMLRGNAGEIPIRSPLIGAFNVANVLAGICGAVSAMPQPRHRERMLQAIPAGIETLPQIPGRMERIDEGQDFTAIVDFAHTPNALQNALEVARTLTSGRVIAVFGSAGLRDQAKRRLMAEVSARHADITVLTAEDPRTESLQAILAEMMSAASEAGAILDNTCFQIADRGRAIFEACQMARSDDVVIVCGKGHEQSMCFGTIEHSWDDRTALRSALRGQPLATLPTAADPDDEAWRDA